MKEKVLRDYFENKIPVELLAADVKNTQVKETFDVTSINVSQILDGSTFEIKKDHLIKLCNDVIEGYLSLKDINSIALSLVFSEFFIWDSKTKEGEIVETVIYDWDSPESNFQLTISNMKLWKEYMETGVYKLGNKTN